MRIYALVALLTVCHTSGGSMKYGSPQTSSQGSSNDIQKRNRKGDNSTDQNVPIVGASSPAGGTGHFKIVLSEDQPTYNLYSPGFPDTMYPPNTQVYYDVDIQLNNPVDQLGARILMYFEMFAVEVSDFCAKDALEIFEPNSQTRVFCASQSGRRLITESSSVRLRFFSDGSEEERGFSIRVELYRSSCTNDFVGVTQGTISTPKFPRDYANFEICVWRIEAPADKRIRVGFNELFEIQSYDQSCFNDALSISKTGDLTQDEERYCGNQAPNPVISTGNVMILKFFSDCCEQGRGFSASFSFIDGAPPPTPEPEIPTNCLCGQENSGDERIIGGNDVSPTHRFPWQLGLVDSTGDVKCGAALISQRYGLTAAHCAVSNLLKPDSSRVLLGAFDVDDANNIYVGIDKYIIHPNFNRRTYANDVALVRLKDDVQYNHDIRPLCLPTSKFETKDRKGIVCGWGSLNEAGAEYSKTLKFVEMDTLPLPQCKEKYGSAITDGHLCAGGNEKDACQGDSGGPLFTQVNDRWVGIGVVSAGIGCGREGYPGIFMNLPSYVDWIQLNTQDSPACDALKPQGPLQPNIDNCGLATTHIESRVVGGSPSRSDYPWMIFIYFSYTSNGVKKTYNGVGVLISPNFVLTALNWMEPWFPNYPGLFDVQLGRYDLSKDESAVARGYKVQAVYPHPNYQANAKFDNDLALLRLTTDVNEAFRPVCLPATVQYNQGSDAMAIGWGRTDTGKYNYVLQELLVEIADQQSCSQAYSRQNTITQSMICAGADGKGMCQGDAGSPLMIIQNGRHYLVGVASYGSNSGCAVKGVPDVYASIPANLDWIGSVTGLKVK